MKYTAPKIQGKQQINSKIIEANTWLTIKKDFTYYGEMNNMIKITEDKSNQVPTMGVYFDRTSRMCMIYNEEFTNKLSLAELKFILLHEDSHLLFSHPQRTKAGMLDPHLSNIVQDMIINTLIARHHDSYIRNGDIAVPEGALFVPKEYKGELVFEHLYAWVLEQKEKYEQKQKQQQQNGQGNEQEEDQDGQGNEQEEDQDGQGNEQEEDQDGQPQSGKGSGKGKEKKEKIPYDEEGKSKKDQMQNIMDAMENNEGQTLDAHITDEISPEAREQAVQEVRHDLKSRGLESADMERLLDGLQKKRKDYLREIKRKITMIKGKVKAPSIKRPNRKNIFGMKGRVKFGVSLNVILDTSGSQWHDLEKILSFIYQDGLETNVIQIDTEIQCINKITSKSQLKNLKPRGGGGSTMMPAIEYINSIPSMNALNTILLTDGYVDNLDCSKLGGKMLIISNGCECSITSGHRKVKQIVVDENYN